MSYYIGGGGIFLLPHRFLEELFLDEPIVNRDILNGLEKWYLYPKKFQFSQKFILLWAVLAMMNQALREMRLLDLSVTFFLFLLNLYKWTWMVVVWSTLPDMRLISCISIT